MAADLPYKAAVKAKPPENDDICIKGICVYGDFDMGATYIQHSAPFAGSAGGPLDTLVSRNGGQGSYFGVGANQISTSFIGLRGKQEIADNLYAVFNLQTLFNPASGMNASGTGTIAQNNGLPYRQPAELLRRLVEGRPDVQQRRLLRYQFADLRHLHHGPSVGADLRTSIVNYDPLSGSNSWSVITFQGANGGGGDTENRIYDNSYEYRVNVGPVRLAGEIQAKNGGNSGTGNAFEGNIGFDYMGFSMDFVGGKIFDAIGSAPLTAGVGVDTDGCHRLRSGRGHGLRQHRVQVGARYTIGPWKFFGGYEHIDYSNPNNPLNPGAFLQGGFIAATVNNARLPIDKILQTAWFGVRYAITPALDITGAYYHEWDNTYATATTTLAGCAALGIVIANVLRHAGCGLGGGRLALRQARRRVRRYHVLAGHWRSCEQLHRQPDVGTTVQAIGSNKSSNYDPGVGLRYQF